MNTRLHYIPNWLEMAEKSNWSASELAKQCDVSLRTLERYFQKNMRRGPCVWLAAQRQHLAVQMLRRGQTVKEVSASLGYSDPAHFSRDFKKIIGERAHCFIITQNVAFWHDI